MCLLSRILLSFSELISQYISITVYLTMLVDAASNETAVLVIRRLATWLCLVLLFHRLYPVHFFLLYYNVFYILILINNCKQNKKDRMHSVFLLSLPFISLQTWWRNQSCAIWMRTSKRPRNLLIKIWALWVQPERRKNGNIKATLFFL